MSDHETHRIIDWLDSGLELFRVNEGRLTMQEVKILSLLAVARQRLSDDAESRRDRARGGAESGGFSRERMW